MTRRCRKYRRICGKGRISFPILLVLLIAVFSGLSCFDDDFSQNMDKEKIPVELAAMEIFQPPVPGNGGIITTFNITDTSVDLMWTRATDNESSQADLQYKVVFSLSNNISTVTDAETNGTLAADWTYDIASLTVSGLTLSTTYFFNVLVMDEGGLRSAYTVVSAATTGNAAYLFSAGTFTGNMIPMWVSNPRLYIDGVCVNAKNGTYPTLPCTNIRAFISIHHYDSIASFPVPGGAEIRGPGGAVVANSWNDLLIPAIDINDQLQNLGIAGSFWWSGSNSDGTFTLSGNNCNTWMDGTNSYQGRSGAHNRTNSEWINDTDRNCNNSLHLLCICW